MEKHEVLCQVVDKMKQMKQSGYSESSEDESMLSLSSSESNLALERDEARVVSKAKSLKEKFKQLLLFVSGPLKHVDINKLRVRLNWELSSEGENTPEEVLKLLEKADNTRNPVDLLNLFVRNKLIGYLNYQLLREFQEAIGNSEVSQEVKEYEKATIAFLKVADLGTLAKVFKANRELAPASFFGLPKFTFRLESDWEGKSMYTWKELLDKKFNWPDYIHIISITPGSVVIECSVLPFFALAVVRDLTDPLVLAELKKQGVTVTLTKELIETGREDIAILETWITKDTATILKLNSEVKQLKSALSQAQNTIASLQKDKDRLELLVREKGGEELRACKEKHTEETLQLMEDMRMLRVNYEEKISGLEELLGLRVQLQQEIAILSALLQEEEARMNIPATLTREKRKSIADEHEPHAKHLKMQSATVSSKETGFIQICDVNLEGEYVQIKNLSDKCEPIGGWKIVHKVESTDHEEQVDFKFHVMSRVGVKHLGLKFQASLSTNK